MRNLLKGRPALLLPGVALAAVMPFGSALAMPDYSATASAILTVESVTGGDGVLITGASSVTEESFDDGAIADIIAFPEVESPLGEGDALTLFLSVSGEASGTDEVSAVLEALGTLVIDNQGTGPVTVGFSFDYELLAAAALGDATDTADGSTDTADGSATAGASILGLPATGPLSVNADATGVDGGVLADFAFFDITVDGGALSSIEFTISTSGAAAFGDGPIVVAEPATLGVVLAALALPVVIHRRQSRRVRRDES